MAQKQIFSVGFKFPGGFARNLPFRSDQSLLDADIIVFKPDIHNYITKYEEYQGRPCLTEHESFRFVEDAARWKHELQTAFDSGKTVFIFLSEFQSVFIHTGERKYSGTGRNRQTTHVVTDASNYNLLPISIGQVVATKGSEIKPAKDLKFLAPYWAEFSLVSSYEVYLEGKTPEPVLITRTGNKVVGAVHRGAGTLILLPPLRYDEEEFIDYDEKGKKSWTKEAFEFGSKLAHHVVEIDKALRSDRSITPPPDWAAASSYRIQEEAILEGKVADITKRIEELRTSHSVALTKLEAAGSLRRLLYESGHSLEAAILEALQLLGFKAEPFKNAESEFDAVFSSDEGRFLGEAEGKDNSAINIDKLSQLERNLQEDYAREEVTEYAKGILFGNAFRLRPPAERADFFTSKCLSGAQRSKIALVRTPDLFVVAKYLKEQGDDDFARLCREVLKRTEGEIVQFPPLPVQAEAQVNTIVEKEVMATD